MSSLAIRADGKLWQTVAPLIGGSRMEKSTRSPDRTGSAYGPRMVEAAETKTDTAGSNGWAIRDEVTQLREWGTNIVYPLPSKRDASVIGTSEGCWLRLWDPTERVSRRHAVLTYGEEGWSLEDLTSKNGIHLDGARVVSLQVVPGAQIRMGPFTLIAESPKFLALRQRLELFLGWGDDRKQEVDQALFSVRVAASHREPLLLCGPGNLVPLARQLHQHALGDRPFVALKPRDRGMAALAAAAGGTLCVGRYELPSDFDEVVTALRAPSVQTLLLVYANTVPRGADIAAQIVTVVRSILIPALGDRRREINRIIDAYADEAIAEFQRGWITPADREWLAHYAVDSLQRLAMATRRIVALHACDESIVSAAKLLSISHGSLSIWMARRSLPSKPMQDDNDGDGDDDDEHSAV